MHPGRYASLGQQELQMQYFKVIGNIILLGLCLWWIICIPERNSDYAAPLIFLITLIITLIKQVCQIIGKHKFVERVKDFGKELRGFDYETRPASEDEIEQLYNDFNELFGNDLMNKSEWKNLYRKNNRIIWFILKVYKNNTKEKIGFFEIFPIKSNYRKYLEENSLDGRTMHQKHIYGEGRMRNKFYYIGSLGVLPNKDHRKALYSAVVLKEVLEYLYLLNQDQEYTLYTRPITPDGKRLVRKYQFEKTDPNIQNHECIWKKLIKKGMIEYDEDGKIKFR